MTEGSRVSPFLVVQMWCNVDVAIVDGRVEIRSDGRTLATYPIRHDRLKEHGALANSNGRPRMPKPAA